MTDLAHCQFRGGDGDLFVSARGAVISAEGKIDEQHVEPEEAAYRPGAERNKDGAGDEAQAAQAQHENEKAPWAERAMRRDDRRKDFRVDGSMLSAVIVIHAAHYTTIPMRKNMTLPKPLWRKTVRQRLVAARKGKAVPSLAMAN